MDVNTIAQLIGSVGFPICMSIYLVYYMNAEQKEMRSAIEDLRNCITALIEKLNDK